MRARGIIELSALERWAEACQHKARPGQVSRAMRAAKFQTAISDLSDHHVAGMVTTYNDG